MDIKTVIKKAGGPVAVATLFGIRSQAVSQWEKIPADRCLALEEVTGISRYDLRPDVFGPAPKAKKRAA